MWQQRRRMKKEATKRRGASALLCFRARRAPLQAWRRRARRLLRRSCRLGCAHEP
jgi:hypothetical protein